MNENISNAVLSAIKQEMKHLEDEIKKSMPNKMMAVRGEVTQEYIIIVKSVFKSVFDNYYKEDYDYDSLMDSLYFFSRAHLWPDLIYSTKKFRFLNSLEKRQAKFNQNRIATSSIKDFRGADEVTLEFANNMFEEYGDSGEFTSNNEGELWDQVQEVAIDFWNFTPINNNKRMYALSPVEEVYRIAYERSMQEFERQYISQIKPRILKKYGIKLG